ncbi:MAG: bifunctional lysine ketoglutarate reductase /saccharopine dehydrogenase family protein [Pseudomonadota bacterium]
MLNPIGIRREDKNEFEKRVPLIPSDLEEIIKKTGAKFIIQPSLIRAFSQEDYLKAGLAVSEDISEAKIVFAVKEIPVQLIEKDKAYVFFSHTIKGQEYNMPLLQKLIDQKCTLIDYEKITDSDNKRLVFFGRYAGIAGMIDTLWAYGKKLSKDNVQNNPFDHLLNTYKYSSLDKAKGEILLASDKIKAMGIPESISPLVIGITGYGNVSKGAQEILDILPCKEIRANELLNLKNVNKKLIYKVVFKEEDLFISKSNKAFELEDYYYNPQDYESIFEKYVPSMEIIVNCIYWNIMYPKLITKAYTKYLYSSIKHNKLKVIGDISCDIEGSIEPTVKATYPDNPAYLYDINKDEAIASFSGDGPVIMAVDNLPCELPKEASEEFSRALRDFLPSIINSDLSKGLENCGFPEEIKRATILYNGEFTHDFEYMKDFLSLT